jgi:hypothetical protein
MSMLRCRYHQVMEVSFGRDCGCGCGCECPARCQEKCEGGAAKALAPRAPRAAPAEAVVPNPLAAAAPAAAAAGGGDGALPGGVQEWPAARAGAGK